LREARQSDGPELGSGRGVLGLGLSKLGRRAAPGVTQGHPALGVGRVFAPKGLDELSLPLVVPVTARLRDAAAR
jgi:hypothetical protein